MMFLSLSRTLCSLVSSSMTAKEKESDTDYEQKKILWQIFIAIFYNLWLYALCGSVIMSKVKRKFFFWKWKLSESMDMCVLCAQLSFASAFYIVRRAYSKKLFEETERASYALCDGIEWKMPLVWPWIPASYITMIIQKHFFARVLPQFLRKSCRLTPTEILLRQANKPAKRKTKQVIKKKQQPEKNYSLCNNKPNKVDKVENSTFLFFFSFTSRTTEHEHIRSICI